MPGKPNAPTLGLAPLDGIVIAAVVAMCGSAIAHPVLQGVLDVLAKRDSSVHFVSWILGGISLRFFVAHAIAAEAFIIAHPRLPTIRRQLEGKKGTLIVGAALGTLLWVVLRALLPIQGPAPMGVMLMLPSLLTMALFSGPLIVWIVRPYLAMDSTAGTIRDARREIGRGWAVILPAMLLLLWAFGTEEGNRWGIAIVFFGFVALVAIVAGTSMLFGGMSKARGSTNERWVRAVPYLLFLAVIVAALAFSR